jgi:tetratricopeptide (TPR) repeat protein
MELPYIFRATLGGTALAVLPFCSAAQALTEKQVEQVAAKITVKITQPKNDDDGSGILVKKVGNRYTVLTAAHVIEGNKKIRITTPDGSTDTNILDYSKTKKYTKGIKNKDGYDLATVEFTSNRNYQIAKLGNARKMSIGTPIYVAGFPAPTSGRRYLAPGGNAPIGKLNFPSPGKVLANAHVKVPHGEQLVYSSNTLPGMSGGPILNGEGELVAVHTAGSAARQRKTNYQDRDGGENSITILYKSDRNWGIPIQSYLLLLAGRKPQVKSIKGSLRPDDSYVLAVAPLDNYNKEKNPDDRKLSVQNFDKLIKSHPNYAAAYAGRADAQSSPKTISASLQDYSTAISLDPTNAYYYTERGNAYNYLKQYATAKLDYDKALYFQPNYSIAFGNRGVNYNYLKQYELALQDLNEAIKLDPNNADFYDQRGATFNELKKYELALKDFGKAIELDPSNINAYNNQGVIYNKLKKYELALKDLNKAIELDPKYATPYNNRGMTYDGQKKHELALKDYSKAIELDPKKASAYHNRGNTYFKLMKFELSLKDRDKAIELDPNDADFYVGRGSTYAAQCPRDNSDNAPEQCQKAFLDFNQAIKLNPNDAVTYAIRGVIYNNLKQYELAIKDFNQAIKLDPSNAEFHIQRSGIYNNLKQYELALQDYNQAIKLDPSNAEFHIRRGDIHFLKKKYELSLQEFGEAIKLDPSNAKAYNNRGTTYYVGLKENSKARQDFQKAATLFKQQGNELGYKGAIEWLEIIDNSRPNNK